MAVDLSKYTDPDGGDWILQITSKSGVTRYFYFRTYSGAKSVEAAVKGFRNYKRSKVYNDADDALGLSDLFHF